MTARRTMMELANADGLLSGISHAVCNITGKTDDYVEFGSVHGRSFYACDNISARWRSNLPR